MGMIDDAYVDEASTRKTGRGKRAILRITALAACFTLLVTGLNLWLFLPLQTKLPDVSQYADSAYYDIIQKLNVLSYRKPSYKNNFQRLARGLYDLAPGATKEDAGDMLLTGTGANGTYKETTDNQVEGVIEADLIKRSDRHIYYMDGSVLRVLEIKGEESTEVGRYEITQPENTFYASTYPIEFYLSADCRTVTYLYAYTCKEGGASVRVATLDVSDPTAISEKASVCVTGNYLSSRLVDGKLLLVCNFYVGYNPDFSDERTFIPQIDSGNGAASIPFDCIISPDVLTSPRYTVVCKLDAETLAAEGANAFLSYASELYVSRDNVYATRTYQAESEKKNGVFTNRAMTEIACLSYAEGNLAYKGSVTVAGEVKDQYSLDEHNGVLRVAVTTRSSQYKENKTSDTVSFIGNGTTNASLYCVRLSDFAVIAAVEHFAPEGESVQSARFDGDNAYVCTSLVLSDPVFFFDLSDLSHITYKDTGTIEGYSSSLVNFGNGFLLGIGVGSSFDTVKIEVYEETETGVASVCQYEVERASYSATYKSYLIDRENSMVGLGITLRDGEERSRYVLLHFNGYDLNILADIPLAGDNYAKRATVIDGYLYAFGENDFSVTRVTN